MNELSFLVLAAVADQPRHGYAILQEIDSMTDGGVAPQVATLYRTIDRLTEIGQLVEHATEVVDGRFRRTYRLTESGAAALAAQARIRSTTARIATKRLKLGAPHVGLAGGAS